MIGLFGTLNLGQRSLQTQQQGIEVAGHNLANVNNPAYSRQRVVIQTSTTVPTRIGPEGTGADVVGIQQLRSFVLDQQIQSEATVSGFLDHKQVALQYAETHLGQAINRNSASAEGAAASQGVGSQHTIADDLSDLFAGFQSLSTDPTSLTERQVLLQKAQALAVKFNQVDQRLDHLRTYLDQSVQSDVGAINKIIDEIAHLNDAITSTESGTTGVANDLRDQRQQQIEELAKLVTIQTSANQSGGVDISVGGVAVISGREALDHLETYDAGGGQMLVRTQTSQTALNLAGSAGGIAGTIEARDVTIKGMRTDLNQLASTIITQVNTVHKAGFSLSGTTGADFFSGTDAATMQVNAALTNDSTLVQASGVAGAVGDNSVALKLAQLADTRQAALSNETFSESYGKIVARMGEDLAQANDGLGNQEALQDMLLRQRDSVSGVSLDEEMTDLMKFQKAFAASARLITTIDEMLDTVLGMKR